MTRTNKHTHAHTTHTYAPCAHTRAKDGLVIEMIDISHFDGSVIKFHVHYLIT